MALDLKRRTRSFKADMNVVPYIDVMLVLVVILMVAAPLVNPSVVNLPSVSKANKAPEKPIELIVFDSGKLSIRNGKDLIPIDLKGLPDAIKTMQGEQKDRPVIISADKETAYKNVMEPFSVLKKAGVEHVGLSTVIQGNTKR